MAVIFDSIIILIFLGSVISGFKKGFLVTVVDTVGFLISLAAALLFTKPFSVFLKGTVIYTNVFHGIKKSFSTLFQSNIESIDLTKLFAEKPSGFVKLLNGFGTNIDSASNEFHKIVASGTQNANSAFVDSIITPAANAVVTVVAFLLILAACSIVLMFVKLIFKGVSKIPVISGANKFAGFIVGILLGALRITIFCMLINLLLPYLAGLGLPVSATMIDHTVLFQYFTEKNPLPFLNRIKP